jgi:hypothetical protein
MRKIQYWQGKADIRGVSLPRGRIQEIKRMMLVNLTHGLFLTWTQKSHYILQIIHYNIYMAYNTQSDPLHPMASLLYLLGEPASLLVVTNTHPPLSLVCQQLPHPLLCPSYCLLPLTLSHPAVQIIYLHRRHQQPRSSLSGTRGEWEYARGRSTVRYWKYWKVYD